MNSVFIEAKNALQNCSNLDRNWKFLGFNDKDPVFQVPREVLETFISLMRNSNLEAKETKSENDYVIVQVMKKVQKDSLLVARTQALYWQAQNNASRAWVSYLQAKNTLITLDEHRYYMGIIREVESAVLEWENKLRALGATTEIQTSSQVERGLSRERFLISCKTKNGKKYVWKIFHTNVELCDNPAAAQEFDYGEVEPALKRLRDMCAKLKPKLEFSSEPIIVE